MKSKQNKLDLFIENLAKEFIKIPNFDLTQKDEVGNRLFNLITFRITEISSYKDLVCQHFIPATNKAIVEGKNAIRNSRYREYINTSEIDFKETLYDTVRLAYVGLFHKLENFINDITKIPDWIYDEQVGDGESIQTWAKRNYGFDFKDWQQFYITHKLNWICNCVKHKDGYPVKEPKPRCFNHLPVDQRIRLEPSEFKKDCEILIDFYPMYIQTTFLFAQMRMMKEDSISDDVKKLSPDLYDKQIELRKKMDEQIGNYLDLLKKMK